MVKYLTPKIAPNTTTSPSQCSENEDDNSDPKLAVIVKTPINPRITTSLLAGGDDKEDDYESDSEDSNDSNGSQSIQSEKKF